MSQIGGKMSKFYGETDIVSTDLRIILSNFLATDVYALFKKSIKKICNMMFKTKGGGGGGQRFFKKCSKKLQIWRRLAPLRGYPHVKWEIENLSQITTTAPIFLQFNYFRQKYLENASSAVSLLNYIWVRVEHSLLQKLDLQKVNCSSSSLQAGCE